MSAGLASSMFRDVIKQSTRIEEDALRAVSMVQAGAAHGLLLGGLRRPGWLKANSRIWECAPGRRHDVGEERYSINIVRSDGRWN